MSPQELKALEIWLGPGHKQLKELEEGYTGSDTDTVLSYYKQALADFKTAVEKLPNYEGDVHRGLAFESPYDAPKFVVGESFELSSSASASKSDVTGESYAMRQAGNAKYHEALGVVIHVKAKTAKDLSPYQNISYLQYESEALLSKGTKYNVVKIDDKQVHRLDDDDKPYGKPRLIRHVYAEEV